MDRPLYIPCHPCACISLDYVTELTYSEGNTGILNVLDRFTKMTYFIPLLKLPTTKVRAKLMLTQVFRLHGFSKDVLLIGDPSWCPGFGECFAILWGP